MRQPIEAVKHYWDAHARSLEVPGTEWGSPQFFATIKAQHDQAYAYANQILGLGALKGRSVLELGCGIGLDTVEFARHGAKVTAIDISPACIALAERILAYHCVAANLVIADVEELPFPPERFDFVVARGILMFTPDQSRTVREIFRVLKPGGEANVLLHNRFSWYVFLAGLSKTNRVNPCQDPPINRLHSMTQAKNLLTRFSSVSVHSDRFPTSTNRSGILPILYNRLVIPVIQQVPKVILRPFGYYLILRAVK